MNVVVKNWKVDLTKDVFIRNNIKVLFLCFFYFNTSSVMAAVSGELLYTRNCMVCHAEDGSGAMPGVSDLTENKTWLTIEEEHLLAKLKNGIQKEGAIISMPAKGGNPDLTDSDLKGIIRYMRQKF